MKQFRDTSKDVLNDNPLKRSPSPDFVREGERLKKMNIGASEQSGEAADRSQSTIPDISAFKGKNGEISFKKLDNYIKREIGNSSSEKDREFWKEMQTLQKNLSEASKMRELHEPYLNLMKPTHYEQSVREVKKELEGLGIDNETVDCVGKDIKKVSRAIQDKIEKMQESGEPVERVTEIKRLVETDFKDQKIVDYDDKLNRQHIDKLDEYMYNTQSKMEKTDNSLRKINNLTDEKDKRTFVADSVRAERLALSKHLQRLFKEVVPRHEASRLVSTERELGAVTGQIYLHRDEWNYDLKRQESNAQYRDFNAEGGLPNPCAPTCITRIVGQYDQIVVSSSEKFHEKFREIYDAHPQGKPQSGWDGKDVETSLNTELEKLEQRPKKEGKEIRFTVRRNFSYGDLKELMDFKDEQGKYVPIIVGICEYSKETGAFNGHTYVLHKQGDRYDSEGNHYVDFDMYNPYKPVQPANKYGLGRIWELSIKQGKDDGSKFVYEPGHLDNGEVGYRNEALIPIV